MIRLIQFLILGHIHEWEIMEKRDIMDWDTNPSNFLGLEVGKVYYLRCKKCGNVTVRTFVK